MSMIVVERETVINASDGDDVIRIFESADMTDEQKKAAAE